MTARTDGPRERWRRDLLAYAQWFRDADVVLVDGNNVPTTRANGEVES